MYRIGKGIMQNIRNNLGINYWCNITERHTYTFFSLICIFYLRIFKRDVYFESIIMD